MNEIEQDDLLDRQLREATPYIDDAGFTAQLLAKLPVPRQQRVSLRATILLGLALLGSLLAYDLSDGARFIIANLARFAALPMTWLLVVACGCGILITAAGLAAAISKAREFQS